MPNPREQMRFVAISHLGETVSAFCQQPWVTTPLRQRLLDIFLYSLKLLEEELVVENFVWARSLAAKKHRQLPPGVVEFDDLWAAAYGGLLQATRTYDFVLGVSFVNWAARKINGAFGDFLRSCDPFSQRVRERIKAAQSARNDLEQWLHRQPTVEEIAKHLGWSEDAVREVLELEATGPGSVPDDWHKDHYHLPPEQAAELAQQLDRTRPLICKWLSELTIEERLALRMHLAGAPYQVIARILKKKKSTATAQRRVKDAFAKLRERLQDNELITIRNNTDNVLEVMEE